MIDELLKDIHHELTSASIEGQSETAFLETILDSIYQFLYKTGQPLHTIALGILRKNTFDIYYRGRILQKYAERFGAMSYDTTIAGRACELYKNEGKSYLHLNSKKKIKNEFTIASQNLRKGNQNDEADVLLKRAETTIDQGIGSFLLIPISYGSQIIGIFTISSLNETTKNEILGVNIEEKLVPIAQMLGLILFIEKISYEKAEEMSRLLISSIDAKDEYQATHSLNVRTMIDMFIDELSKDKKLRERVESIGFQLSVEKIEALRLAALLHDIGKVFIPSSILRKSSLNSKEMLMRKMHSYCTYNILAKSKTLADIADIASLHHARYFIPMNTDNLDEYAKVETSCIGHPFDRLGQNEFKPESQIIALADTFNAIIRSRPDGKGLSLHQAIEIIDNDENKFHSGLKDIFLTIVRRVEKNLTKDVYLSDQAEEYRSALWLDSPKKEEQEKIDELTDLKQYLKQIKFNHLGIITLLESKESLFSHGKEITINEKPVKCFSIDNKHTLLALINIPKEDGFIWIKHIFDYLKKKSYHQKISFSLLSNSGHDAKIKAIYDSLIQGLNQIKNEPVHYYLQPEMFNCT